MRPVRFFVIATGMLRTHGVLPLQGCADVVTRLAFPRASISCTLRRDVRFVVVHRKGYGPKWARLERDRPLFSGSLREEVRFDGDAVHEVTR
jgi:hypothetical protein